MGNNSTSGRNAMLFKMCPSFVVCTPRMHRKNGQFASLKESSSASGWDSSQSGLQDGTNRPETV